MTYMLGGVAIFIATTVLFLKLLPRDGQAHWLARSIWGPYVAVVFTCGFSFGLAMTVTGIVKLIV